MCKPGFDDCFRFELEYALRGLHAIHGFNITHGDARAANPIVPNAHPDSAVWVDPNPDPRLVVKVGDQITWDELKQVDAELLYMSVHERFKNCQCE